MPMSPHILMFAGSETVGRKDTCGPAMMPATIYPRMTGCLIQRKRIVTNPAIINIKARSEIRGEMSDMGLAPFFRFENQIGRYPDCDHDDPRRDIAVLPFQFGHVFEIHTPDSDQKS